ncbi:putative ribonuclease H-like domain-containing protein [Tanacetum coccineum]
MKPKPTIKTAGLRCNKFTEEVRANYSGTTYKGNATSSRGNTTSGQERVVKCYNCQGEGHMARQCTQPKRLRNAAWYKEKAISRNSSRSNSDSQKVKSDPKSQRVPNSETYLNDMDNQSVHALQDFEQSRATVQDTNLQAQQDAMILSVIKQMSEQMINNVNNWEKANKEQNNETITAELERYKEMVKNFEQRLNIDLSSREKMIDSQMDDMIREKLALKEQIDSLEKNKIFLNKSKKRNIYSKLLQFSKMNPKKKKINIWKMKLI